MKFSVLPLKAFNPFNRVLRSRSADFLRLPILRKIAFLTLVAIGIGYILWAERENIFTVRGETENIAITFSNDNLNQWDISHGKLLLDITNPDTQLSLPLDSFYTPSINATARLVIRNQSDKSSRVFITFETQGESVGEIETPEQVINLPSYVELTLDISESKVLPLDGKVRIGEDVGLGVESLLLAGEVSIVEKQFFRDERYVATEHKLDAGDRVELLHNIDQAQLSKAKGFIRITPFNAMSFTIHGEARAVKVHRLGSNSYLITPSVWPRITNDPIIAAISSLLAIIFLLLEFSDLLGKLLYVPRKSEENENQ